MTRTTYPYTLASGRIHSTCYRVDHAGSKPSPFSLMEVGSLDRARREIKNDIGAPPPPNELVPAGFKRAWLTYCRQEGLKHLNPFMAASWADWTLEHVLATGMVADITENYWESPQSALVWFDPDRARTSADFAYEIEILENKT